MKDKLREAIGHAKAMQVNFCIPTQKDYSVLQTLIDHAESSLLPSAERLEAEAVRKWAREYFPKYSNEMNQDDCDQVATAICTRFGQKLEGVVWPEKVDAEVLTALPSNAREKVAEYINGMRTACIAAAERRGI